jgi:hypothetical protein
MGKNVKISPDDMATLSEEFSACRDKSAEMVRSLVNMKECLVDEVYDGLAKTVLRSTLENLAETGVELYCLYEALRMYVEATCEDFQKLDEEAGKDVEENVANAENTSG